MDIVTFWAAQFRAALRAETMLLRKELPADSVSHFHAHLTRHTWATRFKGDILELKRQGGWKDWKQVERYRHGQRPARENLVNPLDLKRTLVTFKRASA